MSFEHLLLDLSDRVATVTINRPDKLNALNAAVIGELDRMFTDLAAHPQVGAVILTGAGRAFVAGADIAELSTAAADPAGLAAVSAFGQGVFSRIERFPRPVIAAVNGFALGGGLELALSAHLRIAADGAKFGLPEAKLGLIPGYGGTHRLPRTVGTGRALQMIFTGELIDAPQALAMGLVNQVVAPVGLMDAARAIALAAVKNGPLALASAIAAVYDGLDRSLEASLADEAARFGELGATADMREGTSAFLEKRAPNFTGQ